MRDLFEEFEPTVPVPVEQPRPATAKSVLAALRTDKIRDEYRPSGLLLSEIQAPNSDRRADAIWMSARTAVISGYEIKVTRQDLLSELRDPTKCEPWLKYCDYWWLAVGHASIVDGLMDQIPADWGVCTPPTSPTRRMFTVLRDAPKLVPADKGPVLGKLVSHQAYKAIDQQQKVDRAEREAEYERSRREDRDDSWTKRLKAEADPLAETFLKVGIEYDKLTNPHGAPWPRRLTQVDPVLVAKAIHDSKTASEAAKHLAAAARAKLNDLDQLFGVIRSSYGFGRVTELLKEIQTAEEYAA